MCILYVHLVKWIFPCFLPAGYYYLLSGLFQPTCDRLSSPTSLILIFVESLYGSDSQLWLPKGITWKT